MSASRTADHEALLGAFLAAMAATAIVVVGLLVYGWHPGEIDQYHGSEGLVHLLGPASVSAGAAVLLLHARRSWLSLLVSVPLVPAPCFAVLAYEIVRWPTSHNLFPFEVAFLLMASVGLHIPAAIARSFRF